MVIFNLHFEHFNRVIFDVQIDDHIAD